ncbi:MAG: hypothetical protein DRP56_02940, partial [Planctomycetota bacterium]
MDIHGKTAIITGASGQLGSEIALRLGRMGVDCLCHYHVNADKANETVEAIRLLGRKAAAVGADLASADTAALLMAEAQNLGPVRVIVNS